jgi:hypothetical protein
MPRSGNAPSMKRTLLLKRIVAWLEDQARRARRGEAGELDLEKIAEEIEGIARSDRREIRNHLIVMLIHLLKYSAQSRRRSSSWLATIGEQRSAVSDDFGSAILGSRLMFTFVIGALVLLSVGLAVRGDHRNWRWVLACPLRPGMEPKLLAV